VLLKIRASGSAYQPGKIGLPDLVADFFCCAKADVLRSARIVKANSGFGVFIEN
jgi:hypothetical protein